jgi:hypothetical protein
MGIQTRRRHRRRLGEKLTWLGPLRT